MFSLELRTITGDVDIPQNNFKTADFNPQGETIYYVVIRKTVFENRTRYLRNRVSLSGGRQTRF